MYGYSEAEALKMNIISLVPEEARPQALQFLEDIKKGKEIESLEVRRRTKDGRIIDVWLTVNRLVDDQRRPVAIASTERDITERKQAEDKLKHYAEELETTNKELEAFSYSVSHDLMAPLRVLDGFSEAALSDYGERLDETGKDYLMRVRKASQTMSELIEALLKLSRISQAEMYMEEVNLSRMAQSTVDDLKAVKPGRQAEVVIAPGIMANGDRALLRILLQNLLDNAWKFTAKCPVAKIEVGVNEKNGEKVYFIRDNGVGFDMKYADKLFQPFRRLHSKDEFPGTGIGLATVQRVINRHGGRIWAEAEIGKGATFYFTLDRL